MRSLPEIIEANRRAEEKEKAERAGNFNDRFCNECGQMYEECACNGSGNPEERDQFNAEFEIGADAPICDECGQEQCACNGSGNPEEDV